MIKAYYSKKGKKMKKLITIIAMLFITFSLAQAEEGKFRMGVEAGYGFADLGAQETAQELANLSGSTVTYTYDKADVMGRIYGQYGINKTLSAEVGYFKSSTLDATYTISGASAKESYDVSGFDLSAVYQADGGIYGKAGIHNSEINGAASVTIGGTTYAAGATASGTGFLVGGGYEGKIDSNMSWTVGITYYDSVGGVSGSDVTFVAAGLRF
tara:strand:- start:615 stop:1253 length:639 start_codon:yes stop_codon:yes gene_type:complete